MLGLGLGLDNRKVSQCLILTKGWLKCVNLTESLAISTFLTDNLSQNYTLQYCDLIIFTRLISKLLGCSFLYYIKTCKTNTISEVFLKTINMISNSFIREYFKKNYLRLLYNNLIIKYVEYFFDHTNIYRLNPSFVHSYYSQILNLQILSWQFLYLATNQNAKV